LAPVQAVVMNITDKQAPYVEKVEKMLKNQGIRVISDLRNEKVGFKIREHTLQRIPYMVVVGDREVEQERIAVRSLGGQDLGSIAVEEFVQMVQQ
jgi:threonyl-tRNA synthetase